MGTKKSGFAGYRRLAGVCTKGSKVSRASRHCWLVPNTSRRGGPHNTRYCNFVLRVAMRSYALLGENQLTQARGAELIRFTVMHDADVAMTLQQRVAA